MWKLDTSSILKSQSIFNVTNFVCLLVGLLCNFQQEADRPYMKMYYILICIQIYKNVSIYIDTLCLFTQLSVFSQLSS